MYTVSECAAIIGAIAWMTNLENHLAAEVHSQPVSENDDKGQNIQDLQTVTGTPNFAAAPGGYTGFSLGETKILTQPHNPIEISYHAGQKNDNNIC